MERIIRNRSATLRKTFYVDGVATDPTGTPTVTITRADGTTVAAGSVTNETEAGTWSITIPATNNTLLDTLTVVWSGVVNGVAQEYRDTVEVAGDVLFTIAQARAALSDPAYDVDAIGEARIYAETELERALGYALVPRYSLQTFRWPRWPIRLKPYVRAVRSVTVDGVAYTTTELNDLSFDAAGFLYSGWNGSSSGIPTVVGYEHGLDTPRPGATRIALATAVEYLGGGSSTVDPRAERLITDDGTLVYGAAGSGQFRGVGVNEWVAANRIPAVA